ncbi:MFS transporter [Gynuella sunshinyii]|uniref:Arabinose efflux permease n=1 Tax=Gynuella sunshinyii YC6258 TaxID=1445510 RepID=A0A0C5VAS1_9GAMM|nr:MFS transporter [Gynuella sunshinyii]AJQ96440.1 arabinose efflux permease [Gynuella sunshinyii YC6258]
MNKQERTAVLALTGVYVVRMLGLFMILPIMMTFGTELKGATPELLGIALGIYGISQALLQVPLGWLSDRIGRKKVIVSGLCLFALGSVVAAIAQDIQWIILGRCLQGAGAIASSTMALLTDLVREEHRTKAMAAVGISIGLSFTVAMMLGPWLATWFGLQGVFAATLLLALVAIFLVIKVVPNPEYQGGPVVVDHFFKAALRVSRNPSLLRLDAGVFILHMGMMSTFIIVPVMLEHAGLAAQSHGWLYMPVMILAFFLMVPFMIMAEKKNQMVRIFSLSILLLFISEVSLLTPAGNHWLTIGALLVLYFIAFNFLEAAMPSLISRICAVESKGTALGVFNTSQFLGAAIGGMLGGLVYSIWHKQGVIIMSSGMLVLWYVISIGQEVPARLVSLTLDLSEWHEEYWTSLQATLLALKGVETVSLEAKGRKVLVKFRQTEISENDIRQVLNRQAA